MAAFEVVVAQERVEVALDFGGLDVPGLTPCGAEAFVEERAVHALDEAVGARGCYLRSAMLDALPVPASARMDAARTCRRIGGHCR